MAGKKSLKRIKPLSIIYIIKSFCGGPGGDFLEKSPLAAGGKHKRSKNEFE
jgi:hypothetical protein